jgi:hypothetical protein
LLALLLLMPVAAAEDAPAVEPSLASRISAADPLNGGYLLVNMHGMLFHPETADIQEDLSYARWLGGSIVRVFATDSTGIHRWDGTQVGARIAEIAPMLRAAHLRLIVAFVNNHQAVPGEVASSAGWMDNYMQLLLPFYTENWRGAYLHFVRDLVSTVEWYDAQDVVFAWELGNELHTPVLPTAVMPFITDAVAAVRALDPVTPILPGTMGANHIEPGNPNSPIARWLYCEAPVDAYTLHAYDWVSRQRPGDMPIDWDLDNIVSHPCPNGRTLPVIVEELGTSRGLAGVYTSSEESARLEQERRQIAFVRHFPQVVGFGVWNGESPRLSDRTFIDTRRGLTSYGSDGTGGGSCYDPIPDPSPGVRCQLEQILRHTPFVRAGGSDEWTPANSADATEPILGSVDPVFSDDASPSLTISGWAIDPSADDSSGIDRVQAFVGPDRASGTPLTAQLGLTRSDITSLVGGNPARAAAGFSVNVPVELIPPGTSLLTLAAHTPERGTWLSTVQVVVPSLGAVPAFTRPVVRTSPAPVLAQPRPLKAEVQSPQPGDQVPRSFIMQVLAPNADQVDVFLEPDRDKGGRMVGSTSAAQRQPPGGSLDVAVSVPLDGHTLYVHVSSLTTGQEQVFTIPIMVR